MTLLDYSHTLFKGIKDNEYTFSYGVNKKIQELSLSSLVNGNVVLYRWSTSNKVVDKIPPSLVENWPTSLPNQTALSSFSCLIANNFKSSIGKFKYLISLPSTTLPK